MCVIDKHIFEQWGLLSMIKGVVDEAHDYLGTRLHNIGFEIFNDS
jgi:hypothetical protein